MKKKIFYSELTYVLGMIFLSLGTALMTLSDFGLSMIVAPAYILHLKISQFLPFFSFGMAEYTFQAILIVIIIFAVRKFKVSYLFSFLTAVIYGVFLDAFIALLSFIPTPFYVRVIFYVAGFFIVTFGVALFFKTYISPEAYELIVKEISSKYKLDLHFFKTIYDISSLVLSVTLSFVFFGFGVFNGVSWGTLVSAIFNGISIKFFSNLLDRHFEFKDRFKFRNFFEK